MSRPPCRTLAAAALALLVAACGARSSTEPSTTASGTTALSTSTPPAPVEPREPDRGEILRRGCPATYSEALALVGELRATPIPDRPGVEEPEDLGPITEVRAIEPEWPERCEYAEGQCRVHRYESGCVEHVDFRCGEPTDEQALNDFQPCDRPDRP